MSRAREHVHGIEIVTSASRVRVSHENVELADTTRAVLLHEGKLPTRYYVPRDDVRMNLLVPAQTRTHCPFKGDATYWSAHLGDTVVTDIAWCYQDPIEGAEKIAGLVCFFNEKVDIDVDGVRQERPKTRWS